MFYTYYKRFLLLACMSMPHIFAGTWYGKDTQNLATIITPVVDLFTQLPIEENEPASSVGQHKTCRRAHQGLYNEVVQCVDEQDDCVCIAFDNLVYGFNEHNQPLNTFWIHKKHLARFSQIEQHAQDTTIFPAPVINPKNNTTAVLTFAWNEYSLGTRFVRAPQHDTNDTYGAYWYNPQTSATEIIHIPHQASRIENPQSPDDARVTFVKLLNDTIDRVNALPNTQVIAYAWGAGNLTRLYTDHEKTATNDGKWIRPTDPAKPYSGYDCSELVFRFAQTSGISYLFKNTAMIEKLGTPLTTQDTLQEGDLLWTPGHVVIVGNIQKNELIEARGYDSGFGKVHRITLEKNYQNIATYDDLVKAYHAQTPLIPLKKDGSCGNTITHYKLIKLPIQG